MPSCKWMDAMKKTIKLIPAICCLLGLSTVILAFFTMSGKEWFVDEAGRVTVRLRTVLNRKELLEAGCNMKLSYGFYIGGRSRRLTELTPNINVSCALLRAQNNTSEAKRVRKIHEKWTNFVSDEVFLRSISNCREIVPTFTGNFYISDKEKNFPLGFVVLVSYANHSVQQYIRLLRFLYRPHNVYCIHIDKKSPEHWIKSITAFASCFPNILVAKSAVEVVYASASILAAHLHCLSELSYSQLPWKYVIDLHGTELPVVTNREMVEELEALKGINPITRGVTLNGVSPGSVTYRKMTRKAVYVEGVGMKLSRTPLGAVPYNMTLYKSADSPNSAFSRDFVHFVLTDARAIALFDYLQDVLSAVEFFFNTLNNLPDAPGGRKEYYDWKSVDTTRPSRLPYVVSRHWQSKDKPTACIESFYRHRICIISASDLQWLSDASLKRQFFFMNKYLMDYDHVVMDCMEEMLMKRNVEEYERDCLKH